jgi:ATP-dependent DNA helicase DinG
VSTLVRHLLLDRFAATVLTSATLTVEGAFTYVRSRLGVERAEELQLPSEFNYREQAILYLPRRMPSPKTPAFGEAAAREVVGILTRTQGRAFVLFTSYAMLRQARPRVRRCCASFVRRHIRCCWQRPVSGKASTWWAMR